nr:glycosyltransferase [Geodermatophilus normandii]
MVRVEASGHPPPDGRPGSGAVRWLGHVPTLAELYARPCVVVSTNPAGHGVQNKLWEAFQARRPIVAFDAALHWAPVLPWIHRVHSPGEFGSVLRTALETDHDTGSRGPDAPGPPPVPAGRTAPVPARSIPSARGRRG